MRSGGLDVWPKKLKWFCINDHISVSFSNRENSFSFLREGRKVLSYHARINLQKGLNAGIGGGGGRGMWHFRQNRPEIRTPPPASYEDLFLQNWFLHGKKIFLFSTFSFLQTTASLDSCLFVPHEVFRVEREFMSRCRHPNRIWMTSRISAEIYKSFSGS